ncbi:hypothetical protein WICPIJ_008576, partial [Wickerhamomyces pijperi]
CGPPKPIGTPNLCEDPRTMSAPNSEGGLNKARAIRSDATATNPLLEWTMSVILAKDSGDGMAPSV